ncbi:MAG TPA: hypothetical protein VN696_16940 [Pyrinomonadaceae bacterium]|nr:hypothetical protein [Pyrinomonadaceae bacterium]
MTKGNQLSVLRSIGAVFTGVLAVTVLSLATDVVLHATGVYPPWFQPMSDPLWVLAIAYRIVYGILGGYIAARLAPNRPMTHALWLGAIGTALTIVGVAMHWNKGPEYGPAWFGIALVATALPCAWAGGKLVAQKRAHAESY